MKAPQGKAPMRILAVRPGSTWCHTNHHEYLGHLEQIKIVFDNLRPAMGKRPGQDCPEVKSA